MVVDHKALRGQVRQLTRTLVNVKDRQAGPALEMMVMVVVRPLKTGRLSR